MAGQLWMTDSLGGYLYSGRLSKELRSITQPMYKFRTFCDVKDDAANGKSQGQTWNWDVVFNVATAGTTLVETNTMPETQFKILQATGTITEAGNSVPWTGKLEALGKFDVRKPVMLALKNDMGKSLDSFAYAEFNKCQLRVVASAGTSTTAITLTTNSVAASSNNVALGKGHIRTIHDTMLERNIPYYDGDSYVAIGRPSTFTTLKSDLEGVNQYTTEGYQKIVKGELGRFENVRFVQQTNIASAAWGNAKSDAVFFLGEECVAEGIAIPEETRAKIPTDYGRSKGMAWLTDNGADRLAA